jgi:alkanesulfonate monooxygenase SsuD/methylene tetrahydromethanopterin reductase-like flavin-dependent oxidoreductase (luciferase family)
MRFGAFLLAAQFPGHNHTTVLDSTVAAAVAAEKAGFDDVWVAEHHFMSYGVCPSAITLAGYLLGATRRVAVGTAVSVLSTQHPVALAEQAALLDQVSGGRFRLGIGRGGPWIDLEVFGTSLDRYQHGFPESLDLLLAALTGNRVAASGPNFRFPEVEVVPRPRTQPHPAIVLAATTAATVELAAQRGLPLLLGMHASDAEKAALVGHYDQLATRCAVYTPSAPPNTASTPWPPRRTAPVSTTSFSWSKAPVTAPARWRTSPASVPRSSPSFGWPRRPRLGSSDREEMFGADPNRAAIRS